MGAAGTLWLEARLGSKHHTMHRAAPTAKIIRPKVSAWPKLISPDNPTGAQILWSYSPVQHAWDTAAP